MCREAHAVTPAFEPHEEIYFWIERSRSVRCRVEFTHEAMCYPCPMQRHLFARLRVWFSIYPFMGQPQKPGDLSPAKREKVKRLLSALSSPPEIDWNAEKAPRVPFEEAVASTPADGGVYYFFRKGDESVLYIGKAKDLKRRMMQYRSKPHNSDLEALIKSGDAEICWRVTPYPGWYESLEHFEYKKIHGDTPLFNRIEGGDSFEHIDDVLPNEGFVLLAVLFLLLAVVGGVVGFFVDPNTGVYYGTGIGIVLFILVFIIAALMGESEPKKKSRAKDA